MVLLLSCRLADDIYGKNRDTTLWWKGWQNHYHRFIMIPQMYKSLENPTCLQTWVIKPILGWADRALVEPWKLTPLLCFVLRPHISNILENMQEHKNLHILFTWGFMDSIKIIIRSRRLNNIDKPWQTPKKRYMPSPAGRNHPCSVTKKHRLHCMCFIGLPGFRY